MDIAGLALLLTIGLLLAVISAAAWTVWRLRHPPRRTSLGAALRNRPGDPGELPEPRAFSAWKLDWRNHTLPVWDIPGDVPRGPVAILTPGWGDSRVGAMARFPALLGVCSRVIAWDPPGLGESSRGPWLMGVHEHNALLELIARSTDERDRVVLYGWSAGAGTSVVAAASGHAAAQRIVGVVAEAPYRQPWTPAFNVLRSIGMPWRLNGPAAFVWMGWRLGVGPRWRGFDRAEHASALRCPLMVIHGDADEVCPVEDGRAIAAAGRGAIEVIAGAGHNDLWSDDAWSGLASERVRSFVRGLHALDGRDAQHVEAVLEDAPGQRAQPQT